MEMIVGRMAKLQVDLLLVGGTVCYTAKEKLLKRGIALAVGVKPRVLERVARCTNTPVLLSPAQVLGATPGTCGRWRVENVSVGTPPPAPTAADAAPPSNAPQPPAGSASRRVTLMYFEGCPPELLASAGPVRETEIAHQRAATETQPMETKLWCRRRPSLPLWRRR